MAASAIVFDLDGTVWDSRPWYAGVLAEDGRFSQAEAVEQLERGISIATLLRRAGLGGSGFANRCRGGPPPSLGPGIEAALKALADEVALGAATNLPGWIAEPMLQATGLKKHLRVLAHWGSTSRHKPTADPILFALEALGVEASESAWYVGDSISDRDAAAAAGVSFAWVSFGYEEAGEGADAIVANGADLLEL